jgi:23S rRNA (guanine745-N1)-methyltransferase
MWVCPHCRSALRASPDGLALACAGGHAFDRAREGYVNLLLPHRKRARNPGDDALMVAARRRVHSAAAYRPLADAVAQQIAGLQATGPILDLGCGEGYYTNAIASAVPACSLYGIDISRAAVRLAARGCRAAEFAVASAYRLPLPGASFDAIVRVFAPSDDKEVNRVLRPGRFYLEVSPAPGHLVELRERLYDSTREHVSAREHIAGMRLLRRSSLRYQFALGPLQLADIIAMTPFAYRGHREKRDNLRDSGLPGVTMAFSLHLFQRDTGARPQGDSAESVWTGFVE